MQQFAELVTVIPGRGLVTLYRGMNVAKVKSYQLYNGLQEFQGRKVSVVESKTPALSRPVMGWLFKEETAKGRCYGMH
jgi:hypothetical protein